MIRPRRGPSAQLTPSGAATRRRSAGLGWPAHEQLRGWARIPPSPPAARLERNRSFCWGPGASNGMAWALAGGWPAAGMPCAATAACEPGRYATPRHQAGSPALITGRASDSTHLPDQNGPAARRWLGQLAWIQSSPQPSAWEQMSNGKAIPILYSYYATRSSNSKKQVCRSR